MQKKIETHPAHDNEVNLNHDKEIKKKVTKLLIVNAVLTFITRVPSFCVTIWLFVHKDRLSEFCYGYFSCPEIVDMAQAFELMFISIQFFLLNFFDKNFVLEFRALFNGRF